MNYIELYISVVIDSMSPYNGVIEGALWMRLQLYNWKGALLVLLYITVNSVLDAISKLFITGAKSTPYFPLSMCHW